MNVSKKMNQLTKFVVFCMLLLTWQGALAQEKQVIDKILATVGGEHILLSEVEDQYNYTKERDPKITADFKCVALQTTIIQKLLINQAKLDSIEVGEEEVENQLDARIERLLAYFNQDNKALESHYGQSVEEMKSDMRNDMRNQMLAERMQRSFMEKVKVTPSEVKEFYSNIHKDSLPYFNSEVEISEIEYVPPVNAQEKQTARSVLEDLRKRIVTNGEDFADIAKKYSADPGSGRNGGDLGWMKRGTFVPEFEAAIYNLEKDQISEIVETEFGFHVIQLLGRRGNIVHGRHILIKPEITAADYALAKAKMDTIRTDILAGRATFSSALKAVGNKNTQSFNNDGRVTNPNSGNTFFELADLDYDIYEAIDKLEVGGLSEPFVTKAADGSKTYKMVKLTSRSKPHKADLHQDYNRIQTAALERKKSELTETWMMDKLKSTYLDIDSHYSQCPNIQLLKKMMQ